MLVQKRRRTKTYPNFLTEGAMIVSTGGHVPPAPCADALVAQEYE